MNRAAWLTKARALHGTCPGSLVAAVVEGSLAVVGLELGSAQQKRRFERLASFSLKPYYHMHHLARE